MANQTKFPVKLRRLNSYIKLKLGYAARKNTSVYHLVCEALALDGKVKPTNVSEKRWVFANADHLNYFVVPSKKQTKPKLVSTFESSSSFLQTYEWRRVRMLALKQHGARCQCCGISPAEGAVINVDHIKPRKLFPELALDVNNLQILCHDCNHGKGNWDMTDWRPDTEYEQNKNNYFEILHNC